MKSRIFSRLLMFASSFALLLTACGGALPTQGSQQPDLSATLSELQGTVEVKNPEQADFSAATAGMHLKVQGQVRTGTDSRARLDLSTGTIVRVAPESMFTLQSNEQQDGSLLTRLVIVAGQVWVILRGGQMEIETPSGVASVRGSYMSVWVDPLTDDVWVTCLEGWCQAENPAAVLDMVAGQGASLYYWDPAGTIPPPPPKLRYLSQDDIDQFLANNPEAQEVMNSVIATASALPTLAPTLTPTPVGSCFELGLPVNGGEVSVDGPVQFDWNDQPDAYKYILNIIKPNGAQKSQIVWRSSVQVNPSELPLAGTYQWSVTAFDSNIQPICTSGPWTFTKAESPTPTPVANCFSLASPADGAALPETGPVTFTWAEQPGRYKYVITFTKPSGGEISLISWTNTYTKNMELLPEGETYSWKVTAYDSTITPICSAGPRTFTKPGSAAPTPTSTPTPGSNSNTCVTLLTPANGASLPASGRVDFTWSEYPGAYKYLIYFKPPATDAFSFIAWTPLHTRWIESLYFGGTYQWWVTVKNSTLQDICTSPAFTFTKAVSLPPTQPSGQGLFWNQSGPTGVLNSCASLNFSVSTNNPNNGTVKVVYSLANNTPNGNVDPHIILNSNSAGNFSGNLSLSNNGQTVYWRFATYDGTYTHDSNIYSFSCPNTTTTGSGSLFWNENVTLNGCTVSASADTNYAGGVKKFALSTSSNPPTSPYHTLSNTGGTSYSTSFPLTDLASSIPAGTKLYWRFEVYDGSYILDDTVGNFVTTEACPSGGGNAFTSRNGPTGLLGSCDSLTFSATSTLPGYIKLIYSTIHSVPDGNVDNHEVISTTGPGSFSNSFSTFAGYAGQTVYYRFAVYNGAYIHDSQSFSFTCPNATPTFSNQSGPTGVVDCSLPLNVSVDVAWSGTADPILLLYNTSDTPPTQFDNPSQIGTAAGHGSGTLPSNFTPGTKVTYAFAVYKGGNYMFDSNYYSFTCLVP